MRKEHLDEELDQKGNKKMSEDNQKEGTENTENLVAEQEAQNEKAEEKADDNAENVSEIDQLKSELAESKDKYLRLYSEFENFRRRTAKEKLTLINNASEDLISALLPVLDDFERASESNKEAEADTIREGFDLIHQKYKNILAQKGLKEMESKQGIAFDSELHEAITQIPAPKKKLVGKVVDVIEKGYYLGEKVIRFAKVVIGA